RVEGGAASQREGDAHHGQRRAGFDEQRRDAEARGGVLGGGRGSGGARAHEVPPERPKMTVRARGTRYRRAMRRKSPASARRMARRREKAAAGSPSTVS